MKKAVSLAVASIFAAVAVAPLAACGGHTEHKWGKWQRSETEHFRVCTYAGCAAEEHGTHDDFVCDDCAEFKVLSFGTVSAAGFDGAHVDFAREANVWFAREKGRELGFIYIATEDFADLNDDTLSKYDVVMFLNNKPYDENQRAAFIRFMNNGGAWMGFHACAYADSPTDWAWYHNEFLRSGLFKSNTWNPTAETLKVDTPDHFATQNLPDKIKSAPNEWYSWQNDLKNDPNVTVLLSLDPSTFPVGDRQGEIWQTYVYCPVAWQNNDYNMIYMNMGHNLMDYNDFEKESETFGSDEQNTFILDALFGLV